MCSIPSLCCISSLAITRSFISPTSHVRSSPVLCYGVISRQNRVKEEEKKKKMKEKKESKQESKKKKKGKVKRNESIDASPPASGKEGKSSVLSMPIWSLSPAEKKERLRLEEVAPLGLHDL